MMAVPISVQSIVSLEKKNKVKLARLMRSVKDQLEKLVHILSHLVYLSVHSVRAYLSHSCRHALGCWSKHGTNCMCKWISSPHDAYNWDSGWTCRENGAQEYSTGYAQDLDEIRALWMAMAQRREALTVRDAHAMFCSARDLPFNLARSTGTPTNTGIADCCPLLIPFLFNNSPGLCLSFACLQELLSTEEKMVHKLELDREKNSVIHLTQAKADCEGIASLLRLYPFPLVTPKFEEQAEIIASLC